MRVTWLSHKGKKVLFLNYFGCKNAEEMIEVLHKEAETLRVQTSKVLVMADFSKFPFIKGSRPRTGQKLS